MKPKHSPTDQVVTVTSVEVLHEHVVRSVSAAASETSISAPSWGLRAVADDHELLRRVRVDLGTIVWPNGADLASEVLHAQVVPTYGHQSK